MTHECNQKDDIRDIRNNIVNIKEDIGGMKASMIHHIKRTDISEERLAKLEKFMYYALGGIMVITFIGNAVIQILIKR